MDDDQAIQPVSIVYNQASISFPLDENAFKEFMVSLLGQPETIEGYVEGAFEMDIGSFKYLDNLIDDRIAKQNLSSLIEFKAKLFFNDGSSMSFNGVQNFISYIELRPLICEGFIFTWSYLVKFHDKPASERQEISISSVEENSSTTSKSKKNKSSFPDFDFSLASKMPRISYSIRCTDKGWGIEITELIRRYLSGIMKASSSPGTTLRRKVLENFKWVVYSCFFISSIILLMFVDRSSEMEMQECRSLSGQGNQFIKSDVPINDKINFLVQIISACSSRSSSFVLLVLPMILFVASYLLLPLLIYKLIQLPNYCFLLFTEASKKERDEYFSKIKDRKTFWIVTVLIGLIIGILGNSIFTWLTTIFR